jgi:hypothetical protein
MVMLEGALDEKRELVLGKLRVIIMLSFFMILQDNIYVIGELGRI